MKSKQKYTPRVGDIVTYVIKSNCFGEGILWQVTKIKGAYVKIEPVFTVNGPSGLNSKLVSKHSVEEASIVVLGSARAQLDIMIREIVRQRSVDVTSEREPAE